MIALMTQIFLSLFNKEKLSGEILINNKPTVNNLYEYQVIFPANLNMGEISKNNGELLQGYHLSSGGKIVSKRIEGPTWRREPKYYILYFKEYYEHDHHRFNWFHKNNRKYKKIRRRKKIALGTMQS